MLSLVELLVGVAVLTVGADFLVRGAVAIAERLHIPHLIIGLTVVAFGTSAPELVVSLNAAFEGSGGIAIGNVVGSNIANILVVLGLPSVICATHCHASGATRNLVFMVLVSLLFLYQCLDGVLTRADGVVMLALFAGFFVAQYASARRHRRAPRAAPEGPVDAGSLSPFAAGAYVVLGLVSLPIAAEMVVGGAMGMAAMFGVSETAIGVTVVALGTSLPELAAAVMAARRGHSAVAVGNAIGSNIFNILAIMGITATIIPVAVPPDFFSFEIWAMIAAAFLLLPFVVLSIPIGRVAGTLMTLAYAAVVLTALGGVSGKTIHKNGAADGLSRAEMPL